MRHVRWIIAVTLLGSACPAWQAPALAQVTPSASFAQLPGRDACVQAAGTVPGVEGTASCTTANGLWSPLALLLSPDQRFVVVASGGRDDQSGIVTLRRNVDSGALSFASCLTHDGSDGRLGSEGRCSDGDALWGADAVAMSPDGRSLFAAADGSDSLTWFDRDVATGALTQRGCFKTHAFAGERCVNAPLLAGASGVAVSPDGTLVFVTAARSGALSVYRRDAASGEIVGTSCISNTGSDGLCGNGNGLRGAAGVLVTPGGLRVLVIASDAGALTMFDVNPLTGAPTQRACWAAEVAPDGTCTRDASLVAAKDAVVSGDGRDVYVGASRAIVAFRFQPDGSLQRNGCYAHLDPTTADPGDGGGDEPDAVESDAEGCTGVRALDTDHLTLSADGRALFAGGSEGLNGFRRDPATGRLESIGCAQQDGNDASCVKSGGLSGLGAMAATADGRNLYIAQSYYHSVAAFAAAVAVASAARVRRDGRARVALRCPSARPRGCGGRLRSGALRRAASYRLARGGHGWVTIRLRAASLRRVRSGRLRGITLVATDRTGATAPAAKRVALRLARTPRARR